MVERGVVGREGGREEVGGVGREGEVEEEVWCGGGFVGMKRGVRKEGIDR